LRNSIFAIIARFSVIAILDCIADSSAVDVLARLRLDAVMDFVTAIIAEAASRLEARGARFDPR
jgi:hypothetical protein